MRPLHSGKGNYKVILRWHFQFIIFIKITLLAEILPVCVFFLTVCHNCPCKSNRISSKQQTEWRLLL